MATVTEMPQQKQLTLPKFEGYTIRKARIAFGGAWEVELTNEEDIAFVKALSMGAEMTVTLAVDGHDREVQLGARCVDRAHGFRKVEESESVVQRHKIAINHRSVEGEGELE